MDQRVKQMLKLVEEDADTFSKKAEMYYQKRPELIKLVEEFYRMYRSLAERYDNVTGELRKNIPSDLQSQGSGISDTGSEPPSTWTTPDQGLSRRRSGPRPAGFEFFLGTGGSSSDLNTKEDESSTLDSESESDDSSVNNYSGMPGNGDDQGIRQKIIEMGVELQDAKEKLRMQQKNNSDGVSRGIESGNSEVLLLRIAGYEEELRVAEEKIRLSEEEIARLKIELHKCETLESTNNVQVERESMHKDDKNLGGGLEEEKKQVTQLQGRIGGLEAEVSDSEHNIQTLEEELKITKAALNGTEKEVASLRHELGSAQRDIATWKTKVDRKEKEVSKMQDRIERYKANLSGRDQEIRALRETISNANQSLSEENSHLQAEVTRQLKERAYLEDNLKEWDLRCQSLEEEVRRVKAGKSEMEALLGAEIEQLEVGIAERGSRIEELNKSLDALKLKYDMLIAERDNLNAESSSKDDRIDQMGKHLHQLHMEHVELTAAAERTRKQVEELRSRGRELEEENERQREVILEGAEEKREAIRQLCFSLEHYRNGYQQLRRAFLGHKRLPVMAS
ncbi:unnamed protein product [Ilex paraguariensis]|uniref:NAB domain-containing protein n=1 Tax=Ilex paraguariensis TaxID=185542 RepID=A0ABC8UMP8_9AQUA